MPFLGGTIGYRLLKRLYPPQEDHLAVSSESEYASPEHKVQVHFGDAFLNQLQGKTVIDFGSGFGHEAIEYSKRGAAEVIGLELRDELRHKATRRAVEAGVDTCCSFLDSTDMRADIVVSLDSFEHFHEPAKVLEIMSDLLKDDGQVWISFAWSWYHPLGGHVFSVFPWAHLVFSEAALIRWRSDFATDGATRFHEVAGGMNQMTIKRFEKLVNDSSLQFEELRLCPIKQLRYLHCRATREFTTSLICARLKKRSSFADAAKNVLPMSAAESV